MQDQANNVHHMNGGQGETSYFNNSQFQKNVILQAKQKLAENVAELCEKSSGESDSLTMADMGCSSGPNTLLPLQEIIETIDSTCASKDKEAPAVQYFLNDLQENDFNTVFKTLLPDFRRKMEEKGGESERCFVSAVPGSFYERLFPASSLHFVHSSSSLHWTSQVPEGLVSEDGTPLNKGNIYIAESSPASVQQAYLNQFEKDFTKFLKSRSVEMVSGGVMVLTFMAKTDQIPHCKYGGEMFQLMVDSLREIVKEGKMEESMLDKFDVPFYSPSADEVRNVIEKEGSFSVKGIEGFKLRWDANVEDGKEDLKFDVMERAKYVNNYTRAALEPMLASHFGDEVVNDLFKRLPAKLADCLDKGTGFFYYVLVSITKK